MANESRPTESIVADDDTSTYAVPVARGMALLDEKVPGWYQRGDLRRLDLHSCLNCVVGQLFAGDPTLLGDGLAIEGDPDDQYESAFFDDGIKRLGIAEDGDSVAYGFARSTYQSWSGLTRAWKAAIVQRRALSAATSPQEQGQ